MRRLIAIAGAVALAGAMAAPAAATPGDPHKVIVCHATSSLANPYVTIEVDIASTGGAKRLEAHYAHEHQPNKRHGHADWIVDTPEEMEEFLNYGCEGEPPDNGNL